MKDTGDKNTLNFGVARTTPIEKFVVDDSKLITVFQESQRNLTERNVKN